MKRRYLTKSRFKLAWECPTKLAYAGDPAYGNMSSENEFLKALARGGFQVGALAKLYHPEGIDLEELSVDEALSETAKLLERDDVTIFEAAIAAGDLLIRADILRKQGGRVDLLEVKAKSINTETHEGFQKKKGGVSAKWAPYLADISFQTLVMRRAYPKLTVHPFLYLTDTSKAASRDGLNQLFFLGPGERPKVMLSPAASPDSVGDKLLAVMPVDEEVAHYLGDPGFIELIEASAKAFVEGVPIPAAPSKTCRDCEFRISDELRARSLQSGFDRCWSGKFQLKPSELEGPFVIDAYYANDADKWLQAGKVFLTDLTEEDLDPKGSAEKDDEGWSRGERRRIHAESVRKRSTAAVFNPGALGFALASWKFPLHMIDFETTTVAVPFHKGMRPYETVAFQFSHHVIHRDGRIEHRTQYLDRRVGRFPNFDFARALKKALEGDEGTIFRYSSHENTVLNQIRRQLQAATPSALDPLDDREELIAWLRSVTRTRKGSSDGEWTGPRAMVDLFDLLRLHYFHPAMRRSTSLKSLLPAILKDSPSLRARYGAPIYGAAGGIPSHNYKDWSWVQLDPSGTAKDPYKLLPPVFDELEDLKLDKVTDEDGEVRDGGTAMTAYAQMQFTQMSETERDRICAALLRYCELDTFAMVLLYEYWKELVAVPE